ncbi:hypothetical protein PV682_29145 [Streptomyces niveiscabiei]|uniref:hypothetical protein n=1 Tax=Streptomyces niveiscabiei TaxID=164115 RepID=UPI0029A90997|nr:hypothetical protein [Streptomyces niveiscabiei]MDX3385500.1 hypothetical protein [Streptomyces niveiscabiei]
MSVEITPAAGTEPAAAPARSTAARVGQAAGLGCAALVAVPLFLGLALLVWLAVVTKDASDFPRVAPQEMADRAVANSREAYGVLGFTRTIPYGVEDIGVSPENILDSGFCYRGGLTDEIVDGAYTMTHSWALDHVTAGQAVPGLRRLRTHLEDSGWDVTSYEEGRAGDTWELRAMRSDGEERAFFSWSAEREYFEGGASMPCAVDPGWHTGDTGPAGDDVRPPDLTPSPSHVRS